LRIEKREVWFSSSMQLAIILIASALIGSCASLSKIASVLEERERVERAYPAPVCDMCGRLECSAETCRPEWEMKGGGLCGQK